MKFKIQILTAIIFTLAIYIPVAQAQANISLTGGSNTPVSLNLQTAMTYTLTTACRKPIPVFKNVGNPYGGMRNVSGTIAHSTNGGAANAFNLVGSGFTMGDITPNDVFLNYQGNPMVDLPVGTTITVNVGALTTQSTVSLTPPSGGTVSTYLVCSNGNARVSNDGVPVTTAAMVPVTGRVLVNASRPLANAMVYLTDSAGNTLVATTNHFGYYVFNEVEVGQTVIVSVASKRFEFAPQVFILNDEVVDLDFMALDQ